MTKSEFSKLLDATFARVKVLTQTKGEEYSRDENQLANFNRASWEAGISPAQAWLVFFNKHIDSIKYLVKTGKEGSEPIEGRIDDAILYLILLKGILKDGKE